MTIKSNKPAVVVPATSALRGAELAKVIKSGDTIGASMDSICQAERKARKGKDVGTVKSKDVFMVALHKGLVALGYTGSTLLNKLVAVRKAINEGKSFEHKPYAKPASKGSQAGKVKGKKSATEKAGLTISLKGEPMPAEVATAFRSFLNKLKANDSYASLASFMIDGIDEYEGK